MSVAFTKESDAEAVAANLPDRPIPAHANLVTSVGLAQIDAALKAARAAYDEARSAETITTDRTAMAQATRELRYWSARRASAQLIETRPPDGQAGFNTRITFEYEDGRSARFHIVGDDEADPSQGRISWAAPVARALTGKAIGDVVRLPGGEAEITAVAPG
jgi:transcription elongation GreA/GreB family factor